ncbi:MAG: hypothetical protein NUW37_11435 [Planctomycetes bacterium]|nr:hypothetical protein [Planctomycetota bacterium]
MSRNIEILVENVEGELPAVHRTLSDFLLSNSVPPSAVHDLLVMITEASRCFIKEAALSGFVTKLHVAIEVSGQSVEVSISESRTVFGRLYGSGSGDGCVEKSPEEDMPLFALRDYVDSLTYLYCRGRISSLHLTKKMPEIVNVETGIPVY